MSSKAGLSSPDEEDYFICDECKKIYFNAAIKSVFPGYTAHLPQAGQEEIAKTTDISLGGKKFDEEEPRTKKDLNDYEQWLESKLAEGGDFGKCVASLGNRYSREPVESGCFLCMNFATIAASVGIRLLMS